MSKGHGEHTEKLYWDNSYQGTVTIAFKAESAGGNQGQGANYSKKMSGGKPRQPEEGKQIGDYLLEKFLAAGSYGRAFKSKNVKTGEIVCVKKIPKSKLASPIEKQMFTSEIKIMRKFSHENIIRLYDLLESGTSYYLVMQLCNQGDVRQYMKKQGKTYMKEEEAIFFLKQIAMGFRELHKANVMHRDFKLDNLFMHDSTVIIADLGFAKAGKTMTTTGCGTPLYMAPEIIEGKTYNSLVDMWSVGITFYEILYGTFPFMGNSTDDIARKAKYYSGDNLKIDSRVNPITKQCEALLKGMLTYDPKKRISWEAFFHHPCFEERQSYQNNNYNPLGSTMHFANKMNKRFEGYRQNAAPSDYDEENDEVNGMINAKGEGKLDMISTICEEEEDASDELMSNIVQDESQGHDHTGHAECDSRYHFEKEKIELMRRAACSLYDLRHVMFSPQYNTMISDGNMVNTLNQHAVPATMLAALAVLKVARTFNDYNLKCLRDESKNLFS